MEHSNINVGKWSQQEHNNFLYLLELFGKDWKKIARMIPTRSESQIRSHAQKFFNKLHRRLDPSRGSRPSISKEEAHYKRTMHRSS